jgi:hypothetical protein
MYSHYIAHPFRVTLKLFHSTWYQLGLLFPSLFSPSSSRRCRHRPSPLLPSSYAAAVRTYSKRGRHGRHGRGRAAAAPASPRRRFGPSPERERGGSHHRRHRPNPRRKRGCMRSRGPGCECRGAYRGSGRRRHPQAGLCAGDPATAARMAGILLLPLQRALCSR